MFKFSFKVMSGEKRKYVAFSLTMMILTTVEFIFFELLNHPLIYNMSYEEKTRIGILSLLIIIFSFFLTFYVNSQYMDYKRRELGLLYLVGRNLVDISMYLLFQYLIIFVVVIPLGFCLGAIFLPIIYAFIAQQFQFTMNIIHYNSIGAIETMVFFLTKVMYLILINIGFTYRNQIIEIMNRTDKKKNKQTMDIMRYGGGSSLKVTFASFGMLGMQGAQRQKVMNEMIIKDMYKNKQKSEENKLGKKTKILTVTSIIVYLVSLLIMIIFPFATDYFQLSTYINSFALTIIVASGLPYIIGKLHLQHLMKDPVNFVVWNDLQVMLKDTIIPLILIVLVLPYVLTMICYIKGDNIYRSIALVGYIVVEIMLAGCLFFKNNVYIHTRTSEFKTLSVMGYNQDLIKKIINKETLYHFTVAVILPFISILIQIIKSYQYGGVSMMILSSMIGSYLIIFIVAYFMTYITFRKEYVGRNL